MSQKLNLINNIVLFVNTEQRKNGKHVFCFFTDGKQHKARELDMNTVPIRRNLTGNAFANGNGTDTEREQERERNGYRTGSERIQNGYRTEMERIQNDYESQKSKKAF